MNLKEKTNKYFEGRVVRKDLATIVRGNLPVPTYVVEYLLAQYCASDDEEMIAEGVESVKEIIRNNYVHRADAERIKSLIREHGRYRVIDKVNVELNDRAGNRYEANFANLGIKNIPIADEAVRRNPKLLSGTGVWSILTLLYDHSEEATIRWVIEDIKPIQIASVDASEYISLRTNFTTDEWMDLLVHSIGINPENLNRRDKLIQISRLLPFIENNYNYIELGPKGTGKSHVFQELSPHGVLVSGGDVTSARLFLKHSGNREILGLVGYWDVVAWDEYEHQPGKRIDPVMIDTMQNYLANKSFNRGKGTYEATASMAFVGNTKQTVPYMLKNSHLFASIPEAFIKGAFLDRIHIYIPGWEVRVLKKSSFSNEFGFITDYLAEILHQLRKQDYSHLLNDYVKFDSSLSERDHNAIRKSFSGFVKLLYPDLVMTREEVLEIIDFATEGRKRVKDQLYIIDPTFLAEPAKFEYTTLSDGQKRRVFTLENLEESDDDYMPDSIETEAEEDAEEKEEPKSRTRITKKIGLPEIKNISIRENQTGVSFKKLFGNYLIGATDIVIEDPYIRYPYQIRNLLELLAYIDKANEEGEIITVKLITWNTEDRMSDSIDAFEEIKESLADTGIQFSYEFKDFHDRKITTNTGWEIQLSRGLDIFEPFRGFTIEDYSQERRKCKAFTVTIVKAFD